MSDKYPDDPAVREYLVSKMSPSHRKAWAKRLRKGHARLKQMGQEPDALALELEEAIARHG